MKYLLMSACVGSDESGIGRRPSPVNRLRLVPEVPEPVQDRENADGMGEPSGRRDAPLAEALRVAIDALLFAHGIRLLAAVARDHGGANVAVASRVADLRAACITQTDDPDALRSEHHRPAPRRPGPAHRGTAPSDHRGWPNRGWASGQFSAGLLGWGDEIARRAWR